MSTDTQIKPELEKLAALYESDERRGIVAGDLLEGNVISVKGNSVYVTLTPYGTGIIYGREFLSARDILRNVNMGDSVKGKVVEVENKDGYIELSLKEARQALAWSEADKLLRSKENVSVTVSEANKGGLILMWHGIEGFLPASQLSSQNYPRVSDGDKDQILKELKKLIGTQLGVQIIAANPKDGKLIFSEKGGADEDKTKLLTKYSAGDHVEGEITGVVDFGVFVKVEDGLEGLVHISELDWSLVEDPRKMFKVGDKVKAKVIDIKDDKISLSIKALKPNPWEMVDGKYKAGDAVDGVIIKFNKHGALVSIEAGVAGLVHVSEFGGEDKMKETIQLGKSFPFKITLFDAKEHRMTLAYAGEKPAK